MKIRPVYSGGVSEVQKAYKLAKEKISIKKLISILWAINYIYPYLQVIGFYLQRAGVGKSELKGLKEMEMKYNFYLNYGMASPLYSKEWKLLYPKNI